MALEIFKLVGSVFVDTDKANESLQKTDKKASGVATTLGGMAKGAIGAATMITGAVAAVGTAAFGMADSVAKSADEIDKASIRMGISTQAYQEYAYAANQCGVETSALEQAAKKLEGTDINFDDAIQQIMSLETAEERSTKAAELFGDKLAYTLSPLIEQTGDDFNALIERANDLGVIMSEDAVKSGVEFGDLMSDLQKSAQALGTSLGGALFPVLIDIINNVLEFMPQIQSYIAQFAPIFAQIVQTLLPAFFEVLENLFPTLQEILDALLPLAIELINALVPLIIAFLPLIEPIAGLLLAIIVPLANLLTELLPPIINIITGMITEQMPALINIINFVAETIQTVLNAVIRDIKPWIESIIQMFDGLATFLNGVFTGNWQKAWEGITQIAKGFVNTIITYIQGTINAVIQLINTVVDSALTLANLIPGVNINTSTAKIPEVSIPLLAKGGTIEQGGSAIVGEAGAELINLPKGATVQPLDNNSMTTLTKDDITAAFVEALQTVGLEVSINPNQSKFFDSVVQQNLIYKKTHGGLSAL